MTTATTTMNNTLEHILRLDLCFAVIVVVATAAVAEHDDDTNIHTYIHKKQKRKHLPTHGDGAPFIMAMKTMKYRKEISLIQNVGISHISFNVFHKHFKNYDYMD
uniref:Uncharacterized protein n=1 Tax=Glossina brevipalpis TaxID=37001 RepID=A0A1A9WM01_9MUSC